MKTKLRKVVTRLEEDAKQKREDIDLMVQRFSQIQGIGFMDLVQQIISMTKICF